MALSNYGGCDNAAALMKEEVNDCYFFIKSGAAIDVIPIARAEFTIAPLLKVPPASRGEPRGARGFGSPCLQGEP